MISRVTNLVTPSPSLTNFFARSIITRLNPSVNFLRSFELDFGSEFPAAPLAITITVSFVLMSPSTLIELNESSTALFVTALRSLSLIAMSVTTKASIVAILGAIIPDPFAAPVIVTFFLPIEI